MKLVEVRASWSGHRVIKKKKRKRNLVFSHLSDEDEKLGTKWVMLYCLDVTKVTEVFLFVCLQVHVHMWLCGGDLYFPISTFFLLKEHKKINKICKLTLLPSSSSLARVCWFYLHLSSMNTTFIGMSKSIFCNRILDLGKWKWKHSSLVVENMLWQQRNWFTGWNLGVEKVIARLRFFSHKGFFVWWKSLTLKNGACEIHFLSVWIKNVTAHLVHKPQGIYMLINEKSGVQTAHQLNHTGSNWSLTYLFLGYAEIVEEDLGFLFFYFYLSKLPIGLQNRRGCIWN